MSEPSSAGTDAQKKETDAQKKEAPDAQKKEGPTADAPDQASGGE